MPCRMALRRGSAQANRPRFGVETGVLARKKPLDQAAAGHRVGREVVERRRVDQRHRVAERKGDVEVVGREEDALPLLAGQPPEQRRQRVAVRQVEEGGRFVQQDDGGVLRQHAGDHHPLAFAVGHAVHRLAGETRHAHQLQRAFDDGAVGLLHASDPVGVRSAAQRHDILAGEVGDADPVGGDEPDGGGPLVGRECCQRTAAKLDIPGGGGAQSGHGPQQGALARAVAADQGGQLSLFERGRDVVQQRTAAVGEGDMVEADAHVRRCCGYGLRRR